MDNKQALSIVSKFKDKYKHLKKFSLEITGTVEIDGIHHIHVRHPLVFDNRLLPEEFEGLPIRGSITSDLPPEFYIDTDEDDWHEKYYRWSPERFEKFVDRCSDEIREKLGNPNMTKKEILDALAFGNFEGHKKKVEEWIRKGEAPPYREQETQQ